MNFCVKSMLRTWPWHKPGRSYREKEGKNFRAHGEALGSYSTVSPQVDLTAAADGCHLGRGLCPEMTWFLSSAFLSHNQSDTVDLPAPLGAMRIKVTLVEVKVTSSKTYLLGIFT